MIDRLIPERRWNENPSVLIDFFDAEPYDWLSNFYPCTVHYEGLDWPTTEHAFQAMKTENAIYRRQIQLATDPSIAKSLGQRRAFRQYNITRRPDWETIKYDVMIDLLRLKFSQRPLADKLLATGKVKLVEGNFWNDHDWGVADGWGANNLGRSIMLVRAELRAGDLAIVEAQ